jgi:predicted transcriptional regulator YdeE
MQKTIISLPAIKLIGITTRTNNNNELDPMTSKIFPIVQRYFHNALFEKIPHRKKPGTTLCVYTEYESEHTGEYTYFIGEEVISFDNCPNEFAKITIPAQTYAKFTNGPAPMPDVVRNSWFKIWKMTEKDLGGTRRYIADFEIYDERAANHQNIVLDILIGINPNG